MTTKRKNGQFVMHSAAMLGSPAYRVMSRAGHKVLARIEIEHCAHRGKDNGDLPVTFDQFAEFGIHRHSIAPAIRECEAIGFIEVTERGRSGNGEYRRPNKFRLTYLISSNGAGATNEWGKIKTMQEAETIAEMARPVRKPARKKNRTPVPENAKPSAGNRH